MRKLSIYNDTNLKNNYNKNYNGIVHFLTN